MNFICPHTESVRVNMMDFAHVFHSHDLPEGPNRSGTTTSIRTSESLNEDDNYLCGDCTATTGTVKGKQI